MKRKLILAMLTLVCALAFILRFTVEVGASTSTSWNFKNSNFKSLGTISSTTTVDNLTLVATSSKTMSVKANTVTVDSTSYTYCLAVGGTS